MLTAHPQKVWPELRATLRTLDSLGKQPRVHP
jgi:hypothetical protein